MGSRNRIIRSALIAACLVLMLAMAAYAYLSASGDSVSNTFAPDSASDPAISETFDNKEKTNVKVNVGKLDYAVYVRAAVVVTWEDAQGNVYAQKPVAGTDYKIILNEGGEKPWFEDDGFYYYRQKVDSEEPNADVLTDVLIESCKPLKNGPNGYTLHVEIIAQTIQALGTTDEGAIPAVTDAWGIVVGSDGKLTEPTA